MRALYSTVAGSTGVTFVSGMFASVTAQTDVASRTALYTAFAGLVVAVLTGVGSIVIPLTKLYIDDQASKRADAIKLRELIMRQETPKTGTVGPQ